jgi:hypothetical protein
MASINNINMSSYNKKKPIYGTHNLQSHYKGKINKQNPFAYHQLGTIRLFEIL